MALTQISTGGIKDDAVTDAKLPANSVGNSEMKDDAVGVAELSATGTASSSTFLRGDNSWVTPTDTQVGGATGADFNDNVKVRFGTGNDLEIYHQGYNSKIADVGQGALILSGSQVKIENGASQETQAVFTEDGSCELYFDNIKRFHTHSTGATITGYLHFGDGGGTSSGLGIGNSDDLQIYHDGSNSYLDNDTGNLFIRNDTGGGGIYLRVNQTEAAIAANKNGAVELYYDNAKKFETSSSGASVWGHLYVMDNLNLTNDNKKINLGDSSDLQIYHDGSNSYIKDTGTGNLVLAASELSVNNAASNEEMIKASQNGAVELYYDNVKKLDTANSGVNVAGYVNATGNNGYAYVANDNLKIALGTGQDLNLYHDGNHSRIYNSSTNDFYFDTGGDFYLRNTNTEKYIKCVSNGSVYIYHDNSYKLYTYHSGAICNGHFRPHSDNSYDLGTSGDRWDDVYATNGTIQTSDKNQKNTIVETDLGLSFVNKLKPVSYKFNGKTRTHYGLISQDVETTLSEISKPTSDFAGFIKEDIPDRLYVEEDEIPEGKKVGDLKTAAYTTYGLRYGEFISPLIKAVQELSAEVETLKTEVAALKAK